MGILSRAIFREINELLLSERFTLAIAPNSIGFVTRKNVRGFTANLATIPALVGKDVFLIPEQESAGSATLGALGTSWATVLNNFVSAGGIVIAASYSTRLARHAAGRGPFGLPNERRAILRMTQ
mgnify:CR=1 FL=1